MPSQMVPTPSPKRMSKRPTRRPAPTIQQQKEKRVTKRTSKWAGSSAVKVSTNSPTRDASLAKRSSKMAHDQFASPSCSQQRRAFVVKITHPAVTHTSASSSSSPVHQPPTETVLTLADSDSLIDDVLSLALTTLFGWLGDTDGIGGDVFALTQLEGNRLVVRRGGDRLDELVPRHLNELSLRLHLRLLIPQVIPMIANTMPAKIFLFNDIFSNFRSHEWQLAESSCPPSSSADGHKRDEIEFMNASRDSSDTAYSQITSAQIINIISLSLFLTHGPYHLVEDLPIEYCIKTAFSDYGCEDAMNVDIGRRTDIFEQIVALWNSEGESNSSELLPDSSQKLSAVDKYLANVLNSSPLVGQNLFSARTNNTTSSHSFPSDVILGVGYEGLKVFSVEKALLEEFSWEECAKWGHNSSFFYVWVIAKDGKSGVGGGLPPAKDKGQPTKFVNRPRGSKSGVKVKFFTEEGENISNLLREFVIVLVNFVNGCYETEALCQEAPPGDRSTSSGSLRTTPPLSQQPMLRIKQPSPSENLVEAEDEDLEDSEADIADDLPRPRTPPLPPPPRSYTKEERAIRILQATYRGYKFRNFIIMQESSIVLQGLFRRKLAVNKVRIERMRGIEMALEEEKRVRDMVERKTVMVEEKERNLLRERKLESVLLVQSYFRGFQVRKRLCDIEEEYACILVQGIARMWLARRRLKKIRGLGLEGLLTLEANVKMERVWENTRKQQELEKSNRLIQGAKDRTNREADMKRMNASEISSYLVEENEKGLGSTAAADSRAATIFASHFRGYMVRKRMFEMFDNDISDDSGSGSGL